MEIMRERIQEGTRERRAPMARAHRGGAHRGGDREGVTRPRSSPPENPPRRCASERLESPWRTRWTSSASAVRPPNATPTSRLASVRRRARAEEELFVAAVAAAVTRGGDSRWDGKAVEVGPYPADQHCVPVEQNVLGRDGRCDVVSLRLAKFHRVLRRDVLHHDLQPGTLSTSLESTSSRKTRSRSNMSTLPCVTSP